MFLNDKYKMSMDPNRILNVNIKINIPSNDTVEADATFYRKGKTDFRCTLKGAFYNDDMISGQMKRHVENQIDNFYSPITRVKNYKFSN